MRPWDAYQVSRSLGAGDRSPIQRSGDLFGELESLVSLLCSAVALGSTCYFWLVRNNRERQNLQVHALGPLTGRMVLFQQDSYPYDNLAHPECDYWIRYEVTVVVVNNSTLPNAALSLRAWLANQHQEWQPAHCRHAAENSQLPINLAPSSTTRLDLILYLPVSDRGSTSQDRADQAIAALSPERRVRLQAQTLSGRKFQFDIQADAERADPLLRAA